MLESRERLDGRKFQTEAWAIRAAYFHGDRGRVTCVALVVFHRGVNVGGHRTFRPSVLARGQSDYGVVNVGATGTAEAGFAELECGLGFGVLIQVAEDEAVAKGVGDAHVAAPGLFEDAGARVFIFFGEELLLIGVKAFDFNAQRGAGTGVAMMFGNVQDAVAFGNLHVERQIWFEAMLPIHVESQEGDVEFLGLGFIKAANYGNWMGEIHAGSLACGGGVDLLGKQHQQQKRKPVPE